MPSNEKLNFAKRQAPIPQSHYYISGPTNIFAQPPTSAIPQNQKRSRPKDRVLVEGTSEHRARLSACGTTIVGIQPSVSSPTPPKRPRTVVNKNGTDLPNKSLAFPIRVVPYEKLAAHHDIQPFDLRIVKSDDTKSNSDNPGNSIALIAESAIEKTENKANESEPGRISTAEQSTSVLHPPSLDRENQLKTLILFLKRGIERGHSFAFGKLYD